MKIKIWKLESLNTRVILIVLNIPRVPLDNIYCSSTVERLVLTMYRSHIRFKSSLRKSEEKNKEMELVFIYLENVM